MGSQLTDDKCCAVLLGICRSRWGGAGDEQSEENAVSFCERGRLRDGSRRCEGRDCSGDD